MNSPGAAPVAGPVHRVGVVEDDPPTRDALLAALARSPRWQAVFAVGSLAEARALPADTAPAVVLVDLGLPDGSGLDLLPELRQRWPACECLVISVFGDEARVIRSIEAGASGYILKGQGEDEVAGHLQHLLEGGSPMSPAIARHLLRRIAGPATATTGQAPVGPPGAAPPGEGLTQREAEVLQLLAKGEPYEAVAARLGLSVNTVRFHVKGLYGKLGVNSRQVAVLEAQRRGLLGPGR
jgi:DNA-binding NarL/FixJ family response regulator